MIKTRKCSRCEGAGQADVIRKVTIHPDGKNCSYIQDREPCALCGGVGYVPVEAPERIKGRG